MPPWPPAPPPPPPPPPLPAPLMAKKHTWPPPPPPPPPPWPGWPDAPADPFCPNQVTPAVGVAPPAPGDPGGAVRAGLAVLTGLAGVAVLTAGATRGAVGARPAGLAVALARKDVGIAAFPAVSPHPAGRARAAGHSSTRNRVIALARAPVLPLTTRSAVRAAGPSRTDQGASSGNGDALQAQAGAVDRSESVDVRDPEPPVPFTVTSWRSTFLSPSSRTPSGAPVIVVVSSGLLCQVVGS